MAKSYLILLLCVFIWALNYIVRQILLREFSPLFLSAFSLTVISVVFLLWSVLTKSLVRLTRRELLLFFLSAGIGLVANQIFLFSGLKYSSATNAALIFSMSPLITAGLAAVFLKETITWRMIAGCLLAITGLFLALNIREHFIFQFGDLLLLGGTFTFSCNLILVRMLSERLSPLIITVYSFTISCLILDPIAMAFTTVNWSTSFYIWGLAFVSVICAQGLTGIMWNKGMNDVGAARSSIILNLQPLMTMLLDFFIFHHTFDIQQIVGAVMVFLGVLVGSLQKGFMTNQN
ncbi:DMT family transporter [Effusibacillus lacus]|uniref:DMT family transporter n=1 Tax=Effusibacillus lacus TaxID=1348429 RepID=UPI000BB98C13|nr:EamA family transporter [Effusibacillus lacus]TCS75865.1 putative membrane protein [Effusibacillus lacus]